MVDMAKFNAWYRRLSRNISLLASPRWGYLHGLRSERAGTDALEVENCLHWVLGVVFD